MTRGDVYMLDFSIPFGSEPGMRRPVVKLPKDILKKIEAEIDYVTKE